MSFIRIPQEASARYKGPVADFASLPTDAADGDVRVTLDTHAIFVYNAGTTTWVSATGGSGLTSLNGQTGSSQSFAIGTTGADFNVSSSGNVHTFNMPDASASNRGVVTTGVQTFAGDKTFTGDVSAPHQYKPEVRTISSGEATAKQLTLSVTPKTLSATRMLVDGGPEQFFGSDFNVVGATLSWGGLNLDGVLASGDTITIIYD